MRPQWDDSQFKRSTESLMGCLDRMDGGFEGGSSTGTATVEAWTVVLSCLVLSFCLAFCHLIFDVAVGPES